MSSERKKTRMPKWLSAPLWLFGLLAAYVAASWFWHTKVHYGWLGPSAGPSGYLYADDPFSIPPYKFTMPVSRLSELNNLFYDFPGLYSEATNPIRLRTAPNGHPYFNNQDEWLIPVTAHLRAMRIPSLLKRDPKDQNTYFRYTYVPDFAPSECHTLTLDVRGENEVISIQSQGQGRQSVGPIQQKQIIQLDSQSARALIDESNDNEFWNEMTEAELDFLNTLVGSIWVFERSTPTDYQMMWIMDPISESELPTTFIEYLKTEGIRLPFAHEAIGRRFRKLSNFSSTFEVDSIPEESPPRDPPE